MAGTGSLRDGPLLAAGVDSAAGAGAGAAAGLVSAGSCGGVAAGCSAGAAVVVVLRDARRVFAAPEVLFSAFIFFLSFFGCLRAWPGLIAQPKAQKIFDAPHMVFSFVEAHCRVAAVKVERRNEQYLDQESHAGGIIARRGATKLVYQCSRTGARSAKGRMRRGVPSSGEGDIIFSRFGVG